MAAFTLGSVLSGCATLPTSGPAGQDVLTQRTVYGPDYVLLKLNADLVPILNKHSPGGFIGAFNSTDRRRPRGQVFGVGDLVQVTIFEASAGGLFIPTDAGSRPGNFVTVPDQTVDSSGNITVPYAGAVRAAGRTPGEVQAAIVRALQNRAIEPQVVVAMREQRSGLVSVLGEVNAPARFSATVEGDRILDAITRAGGPKGHGWETLVILERNGARAPVHFANLVRFPQNNVYVQPGDTIYVYRQPQTFLAFGASGQNGQFPFDSWKISLAEAVAKAGGLLDERAEPAYVFLYRPEPRELAERLGIDTSRFPGARVPVIYNLNLRDPAGFFLATNIEMRDKDVIFVSNADSVEVVKFLQYLRVIIATADEAVEVGNTAISLRNNIRNLRR